MQALLTIEEIEKALGIDKAIPIHLTPSDTADIETDADNLRQWYEADLRRYWSKEG